MGIERAPFGECDRRYARSVLCANDTQTDRCDAQLNG
jgi:hypothetical protein